MQSVLSLETLADRIRKERLRLNITQQLMAERTGVSLRAYRNFEKTGIASTRTLANALFALGRGTELQKLLISGTDYDSIEEFKRANKPLRKRAHVS